MSARSGGHALSYPDQSTAPPAQGVSQRRPLHPTPLTRRTRTLGRGRARQTRHNAPTRTTTTLTADTTHPPDVFDHNRAPVCVLRGHHKSCVVMARRYGMLCRANGWMCGSRKTPGGGGAAMAGCAQETRDGHNVRDRASGAEFEGAGQQGGRCGESCRSPQDLRRRGTRRGGTDKVRGSGETTPRCGRDEEGGRVQARGTQRRPTLERVRKGR